jgi:AraC-like DNA-binding protein/mannose-6-phosphate isomerase-like protein (cupin superfamily)
MPEKRQPDDRKNSNMRVPYSDIRSEYMDTPVRKVFDLRTDGLPEVPSLGWCNYSYARPDVPAHRHFGTFEVHFVERGRLVFEVEGQGFNLLGGDLFVTHPGECHSSNGLRVEPCTLYWLLVRLPKRGRPLLHLPAEESVLLVSQLQSLPLRQFHGSAQIKVLFKQLLDLHSRTETTFRCTRMRQLVVQLLLEVIDCSVRHEAADSATIIQEIALMIRSCPAEEFSLKDLARKAGLSLSWFMAKFKQETGLSPRQLILLAKIDAACQHLRNGKESISKIGGDLGFSTSQYFAVVFRRITGMSPGQYRREGMPRGPTHRREDDQH